MNQMISRRKFLRLPAATAFATVQPGQTPATAPQPVASLAAYNELVRCIAFMALVVGVQSETLLNHWQWIQRFNRLVPGTNHLPEHGNVLYESLRSHREQLQQLLSLSHRDT
jgi:hypothetical protein